MASLSSADLSIGFTTLSELDTAEALARNLVAEQLALCVQLEGPIRSFYSWNGALESTTEYRLMIKFLTTQAFELEQYLLAQHPYDIPEWVTFPLAHVSSAYLEWVGSLAYTNPNQS